MTLENLSDTRVTITTTSLPASPAITNPAPALPVSSHVITRGTAHPVRHNDIITIGDPTSSTDSRQFRLEQSVRFGPALRPEIFDAEEPPSSPLVRGEPVAAPPPPPAGPSTPRLLSTPGKAVGAETTPRSILKKRVQRIRLVSPAKFRSPAGNAMWRAAAAAAVASVVPPGSTVAATTTVGRAAVLGTAGKSAPAAPRPASPAPVDPFWKRPRPPPNLNVEEFTPKAAAAAKTTRMPATAAAAAAELDEVEEDDIIEESSAVVLPELDAEGDEAKESGASSEVDGDANVNTAASPESEAGADIEMGESDGVEEDASACADEPHVLSAAFDDDGDRTADSETDKTTAENDATETGMAAPPHEIDSLAPSTADDLSSAPDPMDVDAPAPMAPSAPVRAFRILDTALQRSSSPLASSRERRVPARTAPLTLMLRRPTFPKQHTQADAPVRSRPADPAQPSDPAPASDLAPESDATAASSLAPPSLASSPSRLPSPLLSGSSPCAPTTPGPIAGPPPVPFLARVVASTPPAAPAAIEPSSPPTPPREAAAGTGTEPASSSPVDETTASASSAAAIVEHEPAAATTDSPAAERASEPTESASTEEATPTVSPLPLAQPLSAPRAVVTVRVEVPFVTTAASDWLPRRSPRKRALPAAAATSADTAADAPATPPPAKRGPGRPRKTPAASLAIAPSTPTRRGPGRPRKVVATPDRATDADAVTDGDMTLTANTTPPVLGPASAALLAVSPAAAAASAPTAPAPSPGKRRAGRPRKYPLPDAAAAGPSSSSTTAVVAAAPPSTPVKRGPGRPRKHPLPASSPLAPSLKPSVPTKRGPGRPRKNAALDMDVASSPIRRGPGRPRKNAALELDVASSPIRRGPGRPRKTTTAMASPKSAALPASDILDVPFSSPIKRGPGRPRKHFAAPIIESVSWGSSAAATAPGPADPTNATASEDDEKVVGPHTPMPVQQEARRPTPASKRARSPPPPPPVGVRRSARVPVRRKLFDQDARIDLDEVVGSDASSSVEEGDEGDDGDGDAWGPASKRARVG
ncbi:hypothetical protein GGF32_004364 [Allomyces javanicus]|nr:hypothetical protein GGF32_004364 [Allomyces javanicus]